MGEAARHDHGVDAVHARVTVPQDARLGAEAFDRPHDVELAVGTGELHHPDAHAHDATSSSISTV